MLKTISQPPETNLAPAIFALEQKEATDSRSAATLGVRHDLGQIVADRVRSQSCGSGDKEKKMRIHCWVGERRKGKKGWNYFTIKRRCCWRFVFYRLQTSQEYQAGPYHMKSGELVQECNVAHLSRA
ncbi:hypothetical protein Patl1_19323 [Pistacia atlantica]|uniref:Uncharacterized protein n=1 Tax=Pistacia atlantica TaxID=434234 RepID=A0ACC1BY65_9ROSI|nr:hypothetical protein Patl1_19323 [Pistacia atlantica]